MVRVYVEMMNGRPIMVYWTEEDALRHCNLIEADAKACIYPLDIAPLSGVVRRYFEHRGLKMPTREQAFLFLTSELGELADELVQDAGGWVRNNPQDKGKGIPPEAGDVLMMLLVFAMQVETWFDPIEAMFAKMSSKGFPLNASRQEGSKEC